MGVVTEQPVWVTGITQIDPNDPVQGGAGGVDNVPHEQLANRTAYLKKEIEDIQGTPTEPVTLETLLRRIKELEEAPAVQLTYLPVGGLFETTEVYTSGAEVTAVMGYGTWQPYAAGRVTVGVSSKTDDPAWTKVIGTEFGSDTHTLTIDEMPAHKHSKNNILNKFSAKGQDVLNTVYNNSTQGGVTHNGGDNSNANDEYFIGNVSDAAWEDAAERSIGGGQPHNNVQSSIVVGKWVRTA